MRLISTLYRLKNHSASSPLRTGAGNVYVSSLGAADPAERAPGVLSLQPHFHVSPMSRTHARPPSSTYACCCRDLA